MLLMGKFSENLVEPSICYLEYLSKHYNLLFRRKIIRH